MCSSQSCHGILDVSMGAVERLHRHNIYPTILILKFRSVKQVREMCDALEKNLSQKISQKEAKERFEMCNKMEVEYRGLVSAVVPAVVNMAYMCTQVKACVDSEQSKTLWIPDSLWWDSVWWDSLWYETLFDMRLSLIWDSLWYETLFDMRLCLIWDSVWYETLFDMRLCLIWDSVWYETLFDLRLSLIWDSVWWDSLWYETLFDMRLCLMRLSLIWDSLWYDSLWYDSLWYETLFDMRLSLIWDSLWYETLFDMRLSLIWDSVWYETLFDMRLLLDDARCMLFVGLHFQIFFFFSGYVYLFTILNYFNSAITYLLIWEFVFLPTITFCVIFVHYERLILFII